VNVVLGYVDIEVIKSVLVKSRRFGTRSNVTGHRVTYYCSTDCKMFSYKLRQSRMSPIRNVVEYDELSCATEKAENSVYLSGKNCALGKFLASKSCLVYFDGSRYFQVGQHLCFYKE